MKTFTYFLQLFLLAIALSGCATTGKNASDPFEPANRAVFEFNDILDRTVLKPTAKVYSTIIPSGIRAIISNIFSNIGEIFNIANNLLQGKPVETSESLLRFAVNTVFGLGGSMDIASKMGLMAHKQDFGLTLGKWGIPSGPYIVLPFFGPSSLRDTAGTGVQIFVDPVTNLPNVPFRNSAAGTRIVDTRANLLDASNLLEEAALDKYSFVRESYLQRRQYLIKGNDQQDYGDDSAITTDSPEPTEPVTHTNPEPPQEPK